MPRLRREGDDMVRMLIRGWESGTAGLGTWNRLESELGFDWNLDYGSGESLLVRGMSLFAKAKA